MRSDAVFIDQHDFSKAMEAITLSVFVVVFVVGGLDHFASCCPYGCAYCDCLRWMVM